MWFDVVFIDILNCVLLLVVVVVVVVVFVFMVVCCCCCVHSFVVVVVFIRLLLLLRSWSFVFSSGLHAIHSRLYSFYLHKQT